MEQYGLSEEVCSQQISDSSLEGIGNSRCLKWRDLPSRLGLPSILVEDIDRSGAEEGEKQLNFFREWRERQGRDATYKKLIRALLDTRCREDAEFVCWLVRDLPHTQQSPTPGARPLSPTQISILPPATPSLTHDKAVNTSFEGNVWISMH